MCGIVGFLTFKSSEIPERPILQGMRDILIHRGPDDGGEYIRPLDEKGPFLFLGHRRLSIIDLFSGQQPLSNEDETVWVIFNGEIYNFKELRERLNARGHRFKTDSDTEVIAHAYEEYGEECFKHLNGMFAIGIWDDRRKQLVLARDRLGKKPLYYSILPGTFLFASEMKAIMAYPNFPRKVAPPSLMKYLFYEFVPSPHSIFEDAMKLPAASYLIWQKGKIEINKYWSPFHAKEVKNLSEEEAESKIIDLLRDSVRRRLMSDVPLGIFLSGGIDSSTIAAFAQKDVSGKVKTFSIGFEDPTFDESGYASLVSTFLGTEHHEQMMTPEDLLAIVPKLPDILDEPMADASILPTYLLSKFTRQHVTVALGGDGGDELFAGYPTYLAHKLARPYESIFGFLHPVAAFLGNLLPVSDDNISFDFKVKKFLSGIGYPDGIRNSIWLGSFPFSENEKVLSDGIRSQFNRDRLVEDISFYEKEYPLNDRMTKLQYLDLRLYLQEAILVKVDRASMACSLEVRAPFLDYELVEFVMRLPSELKLKGFTSKYILKRAMKGWLPDEVIKRPKKGFGVPIAKWVKGPLKELFRDLLSSERIKREGFLNPEYLTTLLEDHLKNKKDNRKQLWTLLVWQLWADRYHPIL
ncbi:MAG: asparagine synthase (glutamine-hydrolyzing) [Deltaproteobacteria bacterium RBG_16_49_23]|nr:MAG: asparagine synthase (glutamine-hydrolyzing) [Deltaproteobacteria bacterium RBG_16_49_23]